MLPVKSNGKRVFGLCRTYIENNPKETCYHDADERALIGTRVTDEIKKAVQKGYDVKEIYEVWHFDEISQYDPVNKEGGIFTEYVNTFLKIKQEASGWPKWCKTEDDRKKYINDYYEREGIWLDAENIMSNQDLRQLAKLMLNR